MSTKLKSGAQIVLECLAQEKVNCIFGYPGGVTLPLYFVSGVFVPVAALPHWLADAGELFPVRHLADALLVAYNPHTTGLGFAGRDLLIVAAWGAAGLLIAVRTFSWLPLGR